MNVKMLTTFLMCLGELISPKFYSLCFSLAESMCNFCADEFEIFINILSFGKSFEVSGWIPKM